MRMSHSCCRSAPLNTFVNQSPPSSQWLCVNERFWQRSHRISKNSGMGHEDQTHLANWESQPPRDKKMTRGASTLWQRNNIHSTNGQIIFRARSPNTYLQRRVERRRTWYCSYWQQNFGTIYEMWNTLRNSYALPTLNPTELAPTTKVQGLLSVSGDSTDPFEIQYLYLPNLGDLKTFLTRPQPLMSRGRDEARSFPTFYSHFRNNKINYFPIFLSTGLRLISKNPWWLPFTFIIFICWGSINGLSIFIRRIERKSSIWAWIWVAPSQCFFRPEELRMISTESNEIGRKDFVRKNPSPVFWRIFVLRPFWLQ